MAEEKAGKAGEKEKDAALERCFVCPLSAMLGAGGMLRSRVADLVPPDFVEHAVGARREFLLAIRSLVDEALKAQENYLENYRDQRAERATRKSGPQKVQVE